MGIKGLSKLIQQKAPKAVKEQEMKSYFGRIVALDASMALYQFLIAVRHSGVSGALTNDAGEVTSHLIGLFYRTIRMMDHGIKPVFVFDGKPPDSKSGELAKRKAARDSAMAEMKDAHENGDAERAAKMERRLVKVSQEHCKDAQRLLDCLGVPWIQAAGEAEATCAAMAKAGLVYGVGTEDMDALTFGTPRLIRHLTFSEARKMSILEFNLERILDDFEMSETQFIDMCILCGCDYAPTIRGIGPKKSFDFITKYGTIEALCERIETDPKLKKKHSVPEDFLEIVVRARGLFVEPLVSDVDDPAQVADRLQWREADVDEAIKFLVDEKGFSKERVMSGLKRLKKAKGKSSQKRMDSFFSSAPSTGSKKKSGKSGTSSTSKRRKSSSVFDSFGMGSASKDKGKCSEATESVAKLKIADADESDGKESLSASASPTGKGPRRESLSRRDALRARLKGGGKGGGIFSMFAPVSSTVSTASAKKRNLTQMESSTVCKKKERGKKTKSVA